MYHSALFPSNDDAVTETFVKPESFVRELADPVFGLPDPAKPDSDRMYDCAVKFQF